ncbi:hypothetical protein P3342_003493 [Pyrenophora teres f. teres]|uniref:Cytochrome P450 67 n=1 Tax=Pyrenophora teres f. teres (strain 0-1) TaxID=861557 RepID=E3S1A0_PYRTT|nr:hypothetical protein PTT_15966 [Pyrenophora teres f. teres 0-1]KAE8842688.1 hypothetical protein HRS9139_01985 [Pyrenophora teres f. teres]KAE8850252.1 hypothetical protein PTNB85_00668 [Pyrenophora teres f. teres]KAE8851723.1 hypothetical protein HRS9122_02010 [Pyrenophora teres f. teres]KAE8870388.1 hypothetical protein PTNB29_00732 [Pyrenophora teres f. teres]
MASERAITQLQGVQTLALGFSLLVSYIIGTVIYRLYFHPLAKYPGPILAKISSFPSWWHTRKQHRHLWMLSLQDQYGPEFRYQPNAVCINTPDGQRQIYGHRGNVRKGDSYVIWRRTVDALNTWNSTSNEIHARKRRVLNYAFSESAIRTAEPFIHTNIDRWIELLGQHKTEGSEWSDSIDMSPQTSYLVFDILGDLCFGKCFDMKEPGSDLKNVPETLTGYIKALAPVAWAPWISIWIWLKPRGLDKLLARAAPIDVRSWYQFVASCQTARAQQQVEYEKAPKSDGRKDFFHYLWQAKDPETGFGYSLPELNAEIGLLIVAGSDTTATVLSALFFYLTRNPSVQEKLTKEILNEFPDYEDIKGGNRLTSCRYLTAFIQEGMRMAPPFSATPSRQALDGGITVNNNYLPKGTLVSTAIWAAQYNPSSYSAPYAFRPERWIVGEAGSTQESVALAESAFCAFSSGPRGCVGKNIAWLEMRIVIAKFIWTFEVIKDPESNLGGGSKGGEWGRTREDQYQLWDMSVAHRVGPKVLLKKREH